MLSAIRSISIASIPLPIMSIDTPIVHDTSRRSRPLLLDRGAVGARAALPGARPDCAPPLRHASTGVVVARTHDGACDIGGRRSCRAGEAGARSWAPDAPR